MTDAVDLVDGVQVGHWGDPRAATGVTVVLLPDNTVASGEVRGGAPGTREWELLTPGRLVERVDAVVLAGGSAPGLAACDGVVRWCRERGRGFPTKHGPIPIVVGAVLYDLGVGDPGAYPDAEAGYRAADAARPGPTATGAVGAGTAATVGSWTGRPTPGGLGAATVRLGALAVSAVVAVNAYGDVVPAGADPDGIVALEALAAGPEGGELTNTTIGVIVTNAILTKTECLLVAQSGHDGLARALEPVHTSVDGDALVAAATGAVAVDRLDVVRVAAARAVAAAVRSAVGGR